MKGPQTSSAGPFAITERPIQCFKCEVAGVMGGEVVLVRETSIGGS